jgi:hypothetical protein
MDQCWLIRYATAALAVFDKEERIDIQEIHGLLEDDERRMSGNEWAQAWECITSCCGFADPQAKPLRPAPLYIAVPASSMGPR